MRVLALLPALAACSFSGSGQLLDGQIDDPPGDAAPDGAPGVDTDGDGTTDDVDNCPIANPDQHDEDHDGKGDACDPCPWLANESSVNTDGDALPDACDPHLTTGGDTMFTFLPFAAASAGLPDGWTSLIPGTTAHWSVHDDALQLVADDAAHALVLNVGFANQGFVVGFDVEPHLLSASDKAVFATMVNVKADGGEYVSCGFRLDSPMLREFVDFDSARSANMGFVALATDPTDAPTIPGTYQVAISVGPNQQTCAIPGPAGAHLASTVVARRANQHVGLRGRNVTIAIRYIAIYRY